jgi:hypothetical protein
VPCLNKGLTRREILEALDESRRPVSRRRVRRKPRRSSLLPVRHE